jgi:hypothetical protein
MVIQRIGPFSVGKVAGALYAAIGLLVGGVVSLVAMAGGMASDELAGAGMGAIIGVGAIVVFPLLYVCLGFLVTMIGAALYNLVAGWVGGIELDVQ